ncbi:MAG: four helix bundle protein [Bacteroidaceae bacterium]|nr:four helix bundle protein [Bacteroidaceae bacterium]
MVDIEQSVANKSYALALRIIKAYIYLRDEKRVFVLSKQLLRSGTSIGAQIREAKFAQSRADFISKLSISLKEANETLYWLELLHDSGFLEDSAFDSIYNDAKEVTAMLVSIVKTSKTNDTPN